jgi:PERQ amino acid-rich with GYF domain-containing protein
MAIDFVTQLTSGSPSEDLVDAHKALEAHLAAAREGNPELESVIVVSKQYEQSYNETLAISGAIWGIVISLVLTLTVVYLFKGSFRLTMLTLAIIIGNLGIIVACFVWMGWTLGGVEAIALSIIVGTSVDYCLHMMEGFAEAAHQMASSMHSKSVGRKFCANQAMVSIGVPIISSAVTTAGAAVFLSTCDLQILAKFGTILVVNVSIAIFLSLTALPALFAWCAPTRIGGCLKRALFPVVLGCIFGLCFFAIYVMAGHGVPVMDPNGEPIVALRNTPDALVHEAP